jgi:choice-of-anchor C domain-containing protein
MNKLAAGFAAATTLVVGALGSFGSARAVGIINGSFETGAVIGATPFLTLNATDSTSIAGWTVTNGSIDYIGTYWTAQDGSRSLDMNGLTAGSISQHITGLTSGQTYQVSFWLAGNPDRQDLGTIKTLGVTAAAGSQTFTFDVAGSSLPTLNWVLKSFFFTADDTSTDLTFASLTGGNFPAFGAALDNVSLSETPLPPALILFGSALAGLTLLGRKRRASNTLMP